MANELNDLEEASRVETDGNTAIIVFLKGLAAKLEAAKMDPVRIAAITAQLKANAAASAAAILENTPLDPNAPPVP